MPVHEKIHEPEKRTIKIVEPEKRDIIKVSKCTDFSGTYTSVKNGLTYRISQEVHPGVCKVEAIRDMKNGRKKIQTGTVSDRKISLWGHTGTMMMSVKKDPSGKVVFKKEGIQWSTGSVWKMVTATTKQTTTTTSTTSTSTSSTTKKKKKPRKPRSTRRRRWSRSTRRRRGSASARRRRRRRRSAAKTTSPSTTATSTKKKGFSIDYRRRRTFSTNKGRRRRLR